MRGALLIDKPVRAKLLFAPKYARLAFITQDRKFFLELFHSQQLPNIKEKETI